MAINGAAFPTTILICTPQTPAFGVPLPRRDGGAHPRHSQLRAAPCPGGAGHAFISKAKAQGKLRNAAIRARGFSEAPTNPFALAKTNTAPLLPLHAKRPVATHGCSCLPRHPAPAGTSPAGFPSGGGRSSTTLPASRGGAHGTPAQEHGSCQGTEWVLAARRGSVWGSGMQGDRSVEGKTARLRNPV